MSKLQIDKNALLYGIIGTIVFFLLFQVVPSSNKTSVYVNYAPDGYQKTISASINGRVVKTAQDGLFWVTLNNQKSSFPFSYDIEKFPSNLKESYPADFIIKDDSIFKNTNNDTFYVTRQKKEWIYVLPR